MAGSSFYQKLNKWYDPSGLFVVKKLLEGCQRARSPVTQQILRAICKAVSGLCYNQYEALLFQIAYLLAYFGLFGVSELIYTNRQHHGRAIKLSDIKFDHGYKAVIVTICHSKINPSGQLDSLRIPCEPHTCFVEILFDKISD